MKSTTITMLLGRILWVAGLVCQCQGSNQTFKDVFTPDQREQLHTFCSTQEYESCGWSTSTNSKARTSCCQECSCRADCDQFGSCCFPRHFPLDRQRMSERPGQECIPMEFGNTGEKFSETKYFFVTTSCYKSHSAFSPNEVDCGDLNVAIWGSLYPVYSPSSRRIYKNAECARCNNVTDTIAWNPFLSCKIDYIRMDDVLEWLVTGEFPRNCLIRFVFPLSSSLVSTESCHPHKRVVDYCEQSPTSEAFQNYQTPCTGGFFSPYTVKGSIIYANLFCAMCRNIVPSKPIDCTVTYTPKIISGSFSCVLTYTGSSKWKMSVNNKMTLKTNTPMACRLIETKMNQSRDCVPVLCPLGQVYADTFQCIHPIKHWMVIGYRVYLRISLDLETDLERLSKVHFGRTFSLKSNWPSNWKIDEIYLEINRKQSTANATVSKIRIGLIKVNARRFVEHSKILDEIKEHVSDKWTITTSYLTAIGSAAVCSKYLPSYGRHFPHVNIPVKRINKTMIGDISKMHLCRRIILNEAEYQINRMDMLQYGNKTFEHQDYDKFSIPNMDKLGVRICIEDSEYTMTSSGSRSVFYPDSLLCRIAVCVILAVLMAMRRSYLRYTRRQREITRNKNMYVEPKENNKGR